ncbi:MAG: ABC transporter ATP-binding protein [Nitriliruptoraceae bacterium]
MKPLLEVEDLETHFMTRSGLIKAVDGVSFHIGEGETLALVGESGSGKSVTALSVLRLVPDPPGKIVGGRIVLEGDDLTAMSQAKIEDVRGNRASMIFQEPLTALNPILSVRHQLTEAMLRHDMAPDRKAAHRTVLHMLKQVGIPDPEDRMTAYPHQLSGGMRQRVMIAMALLAEPRLLIADEPTTALDVTIQAQILELMRQMREATGAAVLMITHDLAVVAEMADRVAVMYAGRLVESAPVRTLFALPAHPYTLGLKRSTPNLATQRGQLAAIRGVVPTPTALRGIVGCRFADRCDWVTDQCREEEPELESIGEGQVVRCWHAQEVLDSQQTRSGVQ